VLLVGIRDERDKAMSTWIEFDEVASKGKTKVWHVRNRQNNAHLGVIKWHSGWRKFAFFPEHGTLFDVGCLGDIASALRNAYIRYVQDKIEERTA
jgi:hypothetical protein